MIKEKNKNHNLIDFFLDITFFSFISKKINFLKFLYSNQTNPFRKIASQYRANNSGDFADFFASRVTALLLIDLLKA